MRNAFVCQEISSNLWIMEPFSGASPFSPIAVSWLNENFIYVNIQHNEFQTFFCIPFVGVSFSDLFKFSEI